MKTMKAEPLFDATELWLIRHEIEGRLEDPDYFDLADDEPGEVITGSPSHKLALEEIYNKLTAMMDATSPA